MGAGVLVVCTGNVCRSPAAQRLLERTLGPGGGLMISSAGTSAMVGAPVDPTMAQVMRDHDLDPDAMLGRQVTADDVRDATVILTMSLDQRREVVTLVPGAVHRAFTIVEFSHLVELAPQPPFRTQAARLADLVAWAGSHRGRGTLTVQGHALEIDDPFGRPRSAHVETFGQIEGAVDRMASVVTETA